MVMVPWDWSEMWEFAPSAVSVPDEAFVKTDVAILVKPIVPPVAVMEP